MKQLPRCVSVKCENIDGMFATQYLIEDIILSHKGKPDGGGSMIDSQFVRDIFFSANDAQFKAIKSRIKARGFKIAPTRH